MADQPLGMNTGRILHSASPLGSGDAHVWVERTCWSSSVAKSSKAATYKSLSRASKPRANPHSLPATYFCGMGRRSHGGHNGGDASGDMRA